MRLENGEWYGEMSRDDLLEHSLHSPRPIYTKISALSAHPAMWKDRNKRAADRFITIDGGSWLRTKAGSANNKDMSSVHGCYIGGEKICRG